MKPRHVTCLRPSLPAESLQQSEPIRMAYGEVESVWLLCSLYVGIDRYTLVAR